MTHSIQELDIGFKLLENVKKFSTPDEIIYNCLMDACLKFKQIDRMLEVYEDMKKQKILVNLMKSYLFPLRFH